jgi:peptidoglycan hydrolase-like protein with peptidoglycan-binding domain
MSTCQFVELLINVDVIAPNKANQAGTALNCTSSVGAAASTGYQFMNDLKFGSTGNDVIELQKKLTAEGVYTGPITGSYGILTTDAVRAYQQKNGLPSVGVVGPQTRAKLNGGAGTSISAFINLLINLGIIAPDKAALAKSILGL